MELTWFYLHVHIVDYLFILCVFEGLWGEWNGSGHCKSLIWDSFCCLYWMRDQASSSLDQEGTELAPLLSSLELVVSLETSHCPSGLSERGK